MLRLAVAGEATAVSQAVAAAVREAVRVNPVIEIVERAAIFVPGAGMKARRVIDLRPKPE
ncbi:MAG: hypothetical protein KatS3mg061_1627 [Dehalococcoidia bacterium]|nr:MAG: hypothetical protein KatS3mg061_1627 [Dehalococcoidia bacterium]